MGQGHLNPDFPVRPVHSELFLPPEARLHPSLIHLSIFPNPKTAHSDRTEGKRVQCTSAMQRTVGYPVYQSFFFMSVVVPFPSSFSVVRCT